MNKLSQENIDTIVTLVMGLILFCVFIVAATSIFVIAKIHNDRAIARDTNRIAVAVEILAKSQMYQDPTVLGEGK